MKIQAERINQNNELLKNDESLLQKQVLELKKENIKNWLPLKNVNNMKEHFV